MSYHHLQLIFRYYYCLQYITKKNIYIHVITYIENEDHHCIWLNNCVGKRNYRPFFVFIVTSVTLCLYIVTFSLVHLIRLYLDNDHSFGTALSKAPVSLLLAILCFILVIPVGGLTSYHCFLVFRGVTTHEQVCLFIYLLFIYT